MFDNQHVDSEISKMESEIKQGLDKLNIQRNMLLSQKDTYMNLKTQISKNIHQDEVMIMIGDGYFVKMSIPEANKFLDRRIANIEVIIKDFTSRLDGSRELIKQFNINDVASNKDEDTNEEGMPFMDIVEELDDDDNVRSVKINKKDFKPQEQKKAKKQVQEEKPSEKTGKEDFIDIVEELDDDDNIVNVKSNGKAIDIPESQKLSRKAVNKDSDKSKGPADKEPISEGKEADQFRELLEDMEIEHKSSIINKIDELSINDDDKAALKEIAQDLQSRRNSNGTQAKEVEEAGDRETDEDFVEEPLQDHILIERQDLLELELIADDFQEGDDIDDDYEFDFEDEFEEEEEEVEGAFFKDNKMNNMLWDQINKLRKNNEVQEFEEKQDKKSGKRVKFAENLDIFEVEKIKYEEPGKKSKFKLRIESSKDVFENPVSDIIETTIKEVIEKPVNDIVESPVNDIVEKPVNDIVENTINDIVENAVNEVMVSEKPPRISRFKLRAKSGEEKVTPGISISASQPERTIETVKETPINDVVEKDFVINDESINDVVSDVVSDSIIETDMISQNDELLDMMRKYNEEIDEIEGPVIKEVKDIEKFNKLQDKLDVDKYELHDHDHDHDAETEEDGKIMTEITEKETTVGDVEDLKDTLDSDVKREYFKLKDKLNESKEFEIEKPKISRFKQRLGN